MGWNFRWDFGFIAFLWSLSEIIWKGSWNSQRVSCWMIVTFPQHKRGRLAWGPGFLMKKTHFIDLHGSAPFAVFFFFMCRTTPQSKIQSYEIIILFLDWKNFSQTLRIWVVNTYTGGNFESMIFLFLFGGIYYLLVPWHWRVTFLAGKLSPKFSLV